MPDLIYEDENGLDGSLSGAHRADLEVVELGDASPQVLERVLAFGLSSLQKILGVPLDLEGNQGKAVESRLKTAASNIPVVGALVAEVSIAGKRLLLAGRNFARPVLAAYVNVLGAFSQISPGRQAALVHAAETHLASL